MNARLDYLSGLIPQREMGSWSYDRDSENPDATPESDYGYISEDSTHHSDGCVGPVLMKGDRPSIRISIVSVLMKMGLDGSKVLEYLKTPSKISLTGARCIVGVNF